MKKKIINSLFIISFIFYIVFLLWIILLWSISFKYTSNMDYAYRSINLIPFNDIINGYYNRLDVWGNIVLFIPLGIYINILSRNPKIIKNISKIATISLSFEVLQYILAIGASDITDIITNTLGGLIGIVLYLAIKKALKDDKRVKTLVSIVSTLVMILVIFIIVKTFIYNKFIAFS